jgi:aminotransferase MxcL
MQVDLTTTAVGRRTLIQTYESFFSHVRFAGTFRLIVTLDPAYGVDEEETAETLAYLDELPRRKRQVDHVVVERFDRHVGLAGALSVLFAHATAPYGVHLEDDWEITGEIDLDGLIADLTSQNSSAIVFTNEHVARDGTFERPGEVEHLDGSHVPLLRLTGASWARHYMPLCPHVHATARWTPALAKALAVTDADACPDERVRAHLIAERSGADHNVLWTKQVLARDTGRSWLAERGLHKAITPRHQTGAGGSTLPASNSGPLGLPRSAALRERALAVIPGMTQTFQKRPENFADGSYPVYLERGDGALVWDVDGNSYVDFICGLGAATLGHNHPALTNVIRERAGRGVLLSLPSPVEVTLAELLAGTLPGKPMVRFLKTGADACSAAIRLARYHTGREKVLLTGYHGWHDQLIARAPDTPQAVRGLSTRVGLDSGEDDDILLDLVKQDGRELAAVVIAAPYHRILPADLLRSLRTLCDDTGALLILDEIVTGFRLAAGGLGELYGVQPDLVCLSKGLAAGMPLSAVCGRSDVMERLTDLRVSTTFGGELLSLEAAKVALREYRKDDYYTRISALGRQLRDGFNAHAAALGSPPIVVGYDAMPCLRFSGDPDRHARRARLFLAEMARRGVLLRRDVNFVCAAHTPQQVSFAVEGAGAALRALRSEGVL